MIKAKHKISNRKQYNQALVNRGSITFWVDNAAIQGWHCNTHHGKRSRGFTFTLKNHVQLLIEQLNLSQSKRFAAQSEKVAKGTFNEAEQQDALPSAPKARRKTGRKPLPADLEREVHTHTLNVSAVTLNPSSSEGNLRDSQKSAT